MKRVLTAAVLIPVVLVIIFLAPIWVFALFVAAVAVLAVREYLDLLRAYGMEPFYVATYVLVGLVFAIGVIAVFAFLVLTFWGTTLLSPLHHQ